MVEWVLIFSFWAGAFTDKDSTALTSVPGFASAQECNEAGKQAREKFTTLVKKSDFVCVRQTKKAV